MSLHLVKDKLLYYIIFSLHIDNKFMEPKYLFQVEYLMMAIFWHYLLILTYLNNEDYFSFLLDILYTINLMLTDSVLTLQSRKSFSG